MICQNEHYCVVTLYKLTNQVVWSITQAYCIIKNHLRQVKKICFHYLLSLF